MNCSILSFWMLVLLGLSTLSAAQTVVFPRCASNLSFNVPYAYVETPPSTHSSWNICVRGENACDALVQRPNFTAPVITVEGAQVDVKVTLYRSSFGICPPPTFFRLTIPPVSSPGPITINYANRFVNEGLIQVPTDPYVFRATITTVATTPVPGLNDLGTLALLLLVVGVGIRVGRN